MSEKRIVVSMACGDKSRRYGEITFPLIQKYAQKCNADFFCMHVPGYGHNCIGYEKVRYLTHLQNYDRVLHIDSDMIVRSNTPNLFDIVPKDAFAGVDEHRYSDPSKEHPYVDRYQELLKMSLINNEPLIPKFYINVGIFMFSKNHENIMKRLALEDEHTGYFKEQTHLNYILHSGEEPVTLLPWKYNYMSLMENHGLNKEEAYIIHYAGGYRGYNEDEVMKMMKEDIR